MKKKNPKDSKSKKQPKPQNTFVPANQLKNIHNQNPIECPQDKIGKNESYSPFAEPFEIPKEFENKTEEEWNTELITEEIYEDPDQKELENNLPITFLKLSKNDIQWLRPNEYITNFNIDKEIKKLYPKKKYYTMRENIKEVYYESLQREKEGEEEEEEEEEENVNDIINDDSHILKKTIYKDFYKYLENENNITVIKFTERDETEEEFKKRVEDTIEREKEELNKYKNQKNKPPPKGTKPIAPVVHKPEDFEKGKILDKSPSNIDVKYLIDKNNEGKISNEKILLDSFLSWVSSIYQFILDLEIEDCFDKKNIFSNIYPQKNGVPIYNKNGHYVIKLYFMGKPRRIDIDDRIPCDKNGEFIFPRCETLNEIWPAIFTKALLKLNVYKVRHPFYSRYEENVDTSYIYALTGYHSEIIENCDNEEKIESILSSNINDDNYINKKKYLLCLNFIKANYDDDENDIYYEDLIDKLNKEKEDEKIRIENEEKSKLRMQKEIESKKKLKKRNTISKQDFIYKHLSSISDSYWKNEDIKRKNKRERTSIVFRNPFVLDVKLNVIANYAYSVSDFFSNGRFNMNRLKVLDFTDLKQTLKENTVVFKQLSSSEKKEYIKQRKELKAKQLAIRNKRVEELKNEGRNFLIIKIKNNSFGQYKLNSILAYSDEEIFMAKKCILNNWKYPPPNFFDSSFKKYDDILNKTKNNNKNETSKKKISSLDWTRNNYIQLIGNDINIYEGTEENPIKDPIVKTSGGNWMSLSDFKNLFNTFLVLHNPKVLFTAGNVNVDDTWYYFKIDIYEPIEDFYVLKLTSNEIENKDKLYSAFLIFEPNSDKTLPSKDKIYSYIIFDIVDNEKNVIEKDITLNKFYSTYNIENLNGKKDYYIIFKGGIYQFGFYLQLFSEGHKIENMTYSNYLKDNFQYEIASFKIEHPMIEDNTYYLITRIHIHPNLNEDGTLVNENNGPLKILFNVKYALKYIKPYIQIFLCKEKDENFNREIFINEQIDLDEGEYFAVFSFDKCHYTLKEDEMDIDVIYNNLNYKIDQIENIDYCQISDKYIPNRHNIIFREMIYSCDIVYTSLYITLEDPNKLQNDNIPQTIPTESGKEEKKKEEEKKEEKKEEKEEEKKEKNDNSKDENSKDEKQENEIQKPLNDKIKLIFELYQLCDMNEEKGKIIEGKFSYGLKGILIKKYETFNTLIIPHLTLLGGLIVPEGKSKGKKNENEQQPSQIFPYLLICYIDESIEINNSIAKNELKWNIYIFSSDSVCFVKDTTKEEHERELKENWEVNEPGRASKAKSSRKRFLLEEEQKNGVEISEEDKKFLSTQRIRKTTNEDENVDKDNKKNDNKKNVKTQPKKSDKKDNKDEPVKRESLKKNKLLPLPNQHCSDYIKNYLEYSYMNRTIQINNIEDQFESKNINFLIFFFN